LAEHHDPYCSYRQFIAINLSQQCGYQETQGEYNAACRYFKTIDIKDLINQRVAGDHNGHRQANKKAIELEISLHFYSLFSPYSSVIHNPYLFKTLTGWPDSGVMMLEPCCMAIISLHSRQRPFFPSRGS
jgi:hypothetical protein